MRLFVILFVTLALTLGATFTGGTSVQNEATVMTAAMSADHPPAPLHSNRWRFEEGGQTARVDCEACEQEPLAGMDCAGFSPTPCHAGLMAPLPVVAASQGPSGDMRRLRRAIADRLLLGAGPMPDPTPPRYLG